jgi:hypothetical protein
MRQSLLDLVDEVLRRGVRNGELHGVHAGLTAAFVPALVRAAVLYGTPGQRLELVTRRIVDFLGHGMATGRRPSRRRPRTASRSRIRR